MKRLVQAITFSLASAFAVTSAMAAPQQQDQQHQTAPQQHKQSTQQQKQVTPAQQKKQIKPSRDWKAGAKVPVAYQKKAYKVDYKAHKLPAPAKGQQWLKVNGEYVLVKTANHQIIKVKR
ncbi:RcnB family protein [Acinetobacter qingfengensis]|uniref:RcnB family protein n=1 Tax=Acinetobacter qingfengensis TaxID=1262585 RepID=A0A1E7QWI7_9GAMM|nr:RcnB family protein [Acinetobacter qingfengensis]OEY91474.1 hypothetical protein BJI46_06990 [Acinetobacter qingfengensis]